MQRFPAVLKRHCTNTGSHNEKPTCSKQTRRFPQEPYRIPTSLDAVKQAYDIKRSIDLARCSQMFDFPEIDRTICHRCTREKALTSIDRRGIFLNSHDFNALSCAQERRHSAATSKDREPPCSALTEERQLRRDLPL